MKTFLLLSLLLFFSSCSKDYFFEHNEKKISNELKNILASDQAVRHNFTLLYAKFKIRDFYTVSDSLRNSPDKNGIIDYAAIPSQRKQVEKFPNEMREDFNYYLKIFEKTNVYVDSINAISIYGIIKKYGYPSYDNRKWKSSETRIGITYVLTHINSESVIGKKCLDLCLRNIQKEGCQKGK